MLAPLNTTPLYSSPESLVPILPSQYADTANDAYVPPENSTGGHAGAVLFGEEEPSFWDLLDVINPLQHIPIVGTIYRELTGDKIGGVAKMAGGFLFGGPLGAAAAAVDTAILVASGKDLGDHAMALFNGDEADTGKTMLADGESNQPPAPTASPRAAVEPDGIHFNARTPAEAAVPAPQNTPASPMAIPAAATSLGVTPQTQAAAQAAIAQLAAEEQSKATKIQTVQAAATAVDNTEPAKRKFMPTPERSFVEPKPLPPAAASVGFASYGNARVNPQTALEVQRIQAETGATQHPMLPKSTDGTPLAADPQWMAAAMMQTLNRYEQEGGSLTPPPAMAPAAAKPSDKSSDARE